MARIQRRPEISVELRRQAAELARRAQEMVDKVSGFRRFDRHRDPDLPQYKQPQLLVVTGFEPHDFEARFDIWVGEYDALACDVMMFLYKRYRDWQKVLREEQGIQRLHRRFTFVVIPTTLERRLTTLRTWVPEVITRPGPKLSSDSQFLHDVGITPEEPAELRIPLAEIVKRR